MHINTNILSRTLAEAHRNNLLMEAAVVARDVITLDTPVSVEEMVDVIDALIDLSI